MMYKLRMTAVSLACLVLSAQAQISFTASGTGTNTFNALPILSSGWSTLSVLPNAHSNIMSAEQLDLALQTNSASCVSNVLGQSGTVSPAPSGNAIARWNSVNQNLQTRPTGNSYALLMATLRNQTGTDLYGLQLSYDYGSIIAAGAYIQEEVPGYMTYYSLSGAPNSWVLIPELSTNGNPETPIHLTATLSFSSAWTAESNLFLLWADDNAVATSSDGSDPGREAAYTIDNFSAEVVRGPLEVTITPSNPTAAQCSTMVFTAHPTGGTPPYSYQWHKDNFPSPLLNATNATLVVSNIQIGNAGSYIVEVTDSTPGNPQSITSNSGLNMAPQTNAPVLLSALGDTNLHTILVSFSEPVQLSSTTGADFAVRVRDGIGELTLTSSSVTNGTNVILTTAEAREFKNYEVVVRGSGIQDSCGGLSATANSSTPLISQIVLIGLGDNTGWNYQANGVDPGPDWMLPGISVAAWSSNLAVFDGKRGSNRTFITLTNLGMDVPVQTHLPLTNLNFQAGQAVIPSYYFRAQFSFPGDPSQSSLKLVTFFDDSGVVFLNGEEAWRLRVTNDLNAQLSFDLYCPIQPSPDAVLEGPFNLPLTNVVNGQNLIAVCLKQVNNNSSDVTMGLSLVATVTNFPAVVSSPTLTVAPIDEQQFEISWPESSAVFQLESTSDLGLGWTQAPEADNPSGGYHRVRVSVSTGNRFFRLHKP